MILSDVVSFFRPFGALCRPLRDSVFNSLVIQHFPYRAFLCRRFAAVEACNILIRVFLRALPHLALKNFVGSGPLGGIFDYCVTRKTFSRFESLAQRIAWQK